MLVSRVSAHDQRVLYTLQHTVSRIRFEISLSSRIARFALAAFSLTELRPSLPYFIFVRILLTFARAGPSRQTSSISLTYTVIHGPL